MKNLIKIVTIFFLQKCFAKLISTEEEVSYDDYLNELKNNSDNLYYRYYSFEPSTYSIPGALSLFCNNRVQDDSFEKDEYTERHLKGAPIVITYGNSEYYYFLRKEYLVGNSVKVVVLSQFRESINADLVVYFSRVSEYLYIK